MIANSINNYPFLTRCRRIHFVGIGGVGMSGLAELLINLGYVVSGSDLVESETTRRLQKFGAKIEQGHVGDHVEQIDVLVYSSAVASSNPEIQAARSRKIPVIPRAEILAELMRMRYGVAVAGAHGKTTTTSLVATVLGEGGLDPTTIVGGQVNSLGGNARLGSGDYLVAEADESDGSFLRLTPTVAIVTNIDTEHLDHYGSFEAIQNAFLEFTNKVPFYGFSVLCADDPHVQKLISSLDRKVVTYGLKESFDYSAHNVVSAPNGMVFNAFQKEKKLGKVHIRLRGYHNVSNAMAAVAVGIEFGISFEQIQKALKEFRGIHRRFEHVGEVNGITVVDDYGHHPKEIQAVLSAARGAWPDRRVVALFQPHRYTRTRDLLEKFFEAFDEADQLALLPIYPAGEKPLAGVDVQQICHGIRDRQTVDVEMVEGLRDAKDFLLEAVQPGDLVITLGAGDIWKVAPDFVRHLRERFPVPIKGTDRDTPPAAGGEAA